MNFQRFQNPMQEPHDPDQELEIDEIKGDHAGDIERDDEIWNIDQ